MSYVTHCKAAAKLRPAPGLLEQSQLPVKQTCVGGGGLERQTPFAVLKHTPNWMGRNLPVFSRSLLDDHDHVVAGGGRAAGKSQVSIADLHGPLSGIRTHRQLSVRTGNDEIGAQAAPLSEFTT
jgi:hypothetical protein